MERFSTDVGVEVAVTDAALRYKATIEYAVDRASREVEVITVIALRRVLDSQRVEVPRWLNDFICENVDRDDLRDTVEWKEAA